MKKNTLIENNINIFTPIAIALLLIITIIGCTVTGCNTVKTVATYTAEYLEANPEIAQSLFDKAADKAKKEFKKKYDKLTKSEQDNIDIKIKAEDHVDYTELNWIYGGFNGSNALRDTDTTIGNLTTNAGNLYHTWESGSLYNWGAKDADDCVALACVFFKDNTGRWVGGKFDWTSQRRTQRPLHHTWQGYKGWTLDNIPNPCKIAYVIVEATGGRRTNIIVSDWSR